MPTLKSKHLRDRSQGKGEEFAADYADDTDLIVLVIRVSRVIRG
jgi:hypothetical protein